MPTSTKELVSQLRELLGDYQTSEEDYYVSDEIAEFNPEHMFSYFRGTLDEQRCNEIERYSQESKSFLEDLIGVGEIVLAEQANKPQVSKSTWDQIRNLPTADQNERKHILSLPANLTFDLAPQTMLAADSGGLDVTAELPFDATVSVYEDDDLILKISSDNQNLDGQLIGYCLSSETEDHIGYVLLRKGLLNKVSGLARLNRAKLAGLLRATFEKVSFSDLSNSDEGMLSNAISQDSDDQRSLAAWKEWVAQLAGSECAQQLNNLHSMLKAMLQ